MTNNVTKIPAIHIKPIKDEEGKVVRHALIFKAIDAETHEYEGTEPKYEALRELLDGAYIEHVLVAPDVHLWCDEEFRLKSLEPSAFVFDARSAARYWDFGGPLVITATPGSGVDLNDWAKEYLRRPPTGYALEPARFEFIPIDEGRSA
jgi:hypothetical protein